MTTYWIGVIAAVFIIWLVIEFFMNIALLIDFHPWMYIFFLFAFLSWNVFIILGAAFVFYVVYSFMKFIIISFIRNGGIL